ncbi:hypothetical protein BJX68DRAFT_229427 [Aspergillus pseudodeflectus]|uniref:Uncharacterized protein n=1 Tax=Aspergillus pseudodeflectus TaxID=176178 RepID=A0ABR4KWV4_9EURO
MDSLDTYRPIFKFLQKKGVKKIFQITVNDLVGQLTRQYNILHWDWQKLDISSDTILAAAPDVKTVVMHSSGNFSTLQGWACKHGLSRLKKLRSLHVVIHKVSLLSTLASATNTYTRPVRLQYEQKVSTEHWLQVVKLRFFFPVMRCAKDY